MTHFVEQCEHGTVYAQCRCPSPDKTVRRVQCGERCPHYLAQGNPDRIVWIERIAADLHLARCVVPGCSEASDDDRHAAAIIWQIAKTDPARGTSGDLCDKVMRHMAKIAWPDDPSPLEEQGYVAGSGERG